MLAGGSSKGFFVCEMIERCAGDVSSLKAMLLKHPFRPFAFAALSVAVFGGFLYTMEVIMTSRKQATRMPEEAAINVTVPKGSPSRTFGTERGRKIGFITKLRG